jgi:hypothetical protein
MADIVDRLRGDLDKLSSPQLRELAEEAAKEIVRLRGRVASLREWLEQEDLGDG